MSELRYSELKYNGQTYTEQWKIDEILLKNKFNWMVNSEIKNARLEIFNDTLVWNGGIWYAGEWHFGVFRDGEWRSGTWENGVWYNGTWQNGTFKSGLIFKGIFFKGKIEGGEIRGGNFINVEISPNVTEYTGDEYQMKQQEEQQKQAQVVAQAQPETTNPDQVRVHGTKPAAQQQMVETQPRIQQKNKKYNMKKLKTFENFDSDEYIDFNDLLPKEEEKITTKYLEKTLSDIDKLGDFFEKTQKLIDLRAKYPYIKRDNPYRDIWFKYIKKWHEQLKKSNLSKEDDQIIRDITNSKYRYEK